MSFDNFFKRIVDLLPWEVLDEKQAEALAHLNPAKIYIENVRSVLDVSTRRAEQICEAAVRRGVFQRGVEVLCPDGAVAASAPSEAQLPATVPCWVETGREIDEVEIPTADLRKMIFYRLVENAPSNTYGRTA